MQLSFPKLSLVAVLASGVILVACGDKDKKPEANSFVPKNPECIAPAKPGGGFDLTCKFVQSGFNDLQTFSKPLKISYLPGGVGAVAFNKMLGQSAKDDNLIVAFSSGSILNLAQGKFGKGKFDDVKWLGALGADYGMVAVKSSSPLKNLNDLAEKLKADPSSVVIGAGATVGGQDWMQTALLAKSMGVDVTKIRYVALEGGGEVNSAALGGHVDVISGGLAEVLTLVESGDLRVLAVFAENPIPGYNFSTAKQQGYDVTWPVIRGYYVGKEVSDQAYNFWLTKLQEIGNNPEEIKKLRNQYGLLPYFKTGNEFVQELEERYKVFTSLSKEFNLIKEN